MRGAKPPNLARMRLVLRVLTGCLVWGALACGSEDSPGGSGGASGSSTSEAGKSSSSSAGAGSGAGTSSSAGSPSGGRSSHAGAANTAGTANTTAGSSAGGNGGLSPACQKFCDCHAANCATLAIPDGKSCAEFCEAMTEDQLACRQNMCKLVPDQPDNDHCKHSLGIDQCL